MAASARGVLLRGLRAVALAYGGYLALLFFAQRSVIFPGADVEGDGRPRAGVREVWLAGADSVQVWFLTSDSARALPTVVFAHGNGETIDEWARPMSDLVGRGLNVVLVEFPGYGRAPGKPSRATIAAAFDRAYDWATAQPEVDPRRMVVWGRSVGGGAAGDLVQARRAAALVFQSTFSSTGDMAWQDFKAPPFLVRDRFDNRAALAAFAGPVLLMHGRTDEVIAFAHAERLAAARPGLEISLLPCGHNDCSPSWPEIADRVVGFLAGQGLLEARPPS